MDMIPDQAVKILRLALNPASESGEWRNAAVKFISILRNAGFLPEDFRAGGNEREEETDEPAAYFMSFGKYRGKPIHDVPTDYLLWIISLPDMSEHVKKEARKELKSRK